MAAQQPISSSSKYEKVLPRSAQECLLNLCNNDQRIEKKCAKVPNLAKQLLSVLESNEDAYFPSIDALKNYVIERL